MEEFLEMSGATIKDSLIKNYYIFQQVIGVCAFAGLAVALSRTSSISGIGSLFFGFGILAFILLGGFLLFSSGRNPFNTANIKGVFVCAVAVFFFSGLVVGVAEYAIAGAFFLLLAVLYFLEPITTSSHPHIASSISNCESKCGLLQREAWKKEIWRRDSKGR